MKGISLLLGCILFLLTSCAPDPATPSSKQAGAVELTQPATSMPESFQSYVNPEVGYSLSIPSSWTIDESGLTSGEQKEVVFYPPNPEPFSAYLSIGLEFRSLDQIRELYAQSLPEATLEEAALNGQAGIKFTHPGERIEFYIPVKSWIVRVATDMPQDGSVQQALLSIQFAQE